MADKIGTANSIMGSATSAPIASQIIRNAIVSPSIGTANGNIMEPAQNPSMPSKWRNPYSTNSTEALNADLA